MDAPRSIPLPIFPSPATRRRSTEESRRRRWSLQRKSQAEIKASGGKVPSYPKNKRPKFCQRGLLHKQKRSPNGDYITADRSDVCNHHENAHTDDKCGECRGRNKHHEFTYDRSPSL